MYVLYGKVGAKNYAVLSDSTLFTFDYSEGTATISFYERQDLSSFLPAKTATSSTAKIMGYVVSDNFYFLSSKNDLEDYYIEFSYNDDGNYIYNETLFKTFINYRFDGVFVSVSHKQDLKTLTGNDSIPEIQGYDATDAIDNEYLIPMTEDEFTAYLKAKASIIKSPVMRFDQYPYYEVEITGFDSVRYFHGYLKMIIDTVESSSLDKNVFGRKINSDSDILNDEDEATIFGLEIRTYSRTEDRTTYLNENYVAIGSTPFYESKDHKTLATTGLESGREKSCSDTIDLMIAPNLRVEEGYDKMLDYFGVIKADDMYVFAPIFGVNDNVTPLFVIHSSILKAKEGLKAFVIDSKTDEEEETASDNQMSIVYCVNKASKEKLEDIAKYYLGKKITVPDDLVVYINPTSEYKIVGEDSELSKLAALLGFTSMTTVTNDYGSAQYSKGLIEVEEGMGVRIENYISQIEKIIGTEIDLDITKCSYTSSNQALEIKDKTVYESLLKKIKDNSRSTVTDNSFFYTKNGFILISESEGSYLLKPTVLDDLSGLPTTVNGVDIIGSKMEGIYYDYNFINTAGMKNLAETSMVSKGYVKKADGNYDKDNIVIKPNYNSSTSFITYSINGDSWTGGSVTSNTCLVLFYQVTSKALYIPVSYDFSFTTGDRNFFEFDLRVQTEKAEAMKARFENLFDIKFSGDSLVGTGFKIVKTENSFNFKKVI